MKFIKISILATLLISTSAIAQQFAATGIHAGFGVNSVNPVATFQNVSKYMESADFKKLGITAGLYANNVNGTDDTTHLIEFYYPDAKSYQKAVDMAATSSAVANLLSTAAQANGFEDVTLSAFQINTGDYSGQILVVTQAPNAKRLGQFLDARNEAWSTSLGNRFPKLRKLKRGIMMNCEVVYVR